jgi:hypothetical protein
MDKRLTRTALILKNAERINKNRHAEDISGNRGLSWAYSQTHSTPLAVRTSRNGRGQELEAKRRLVYNYLVFPPKVGPTVDRIRHAMSIPNSYLVYSPDRQLFHLR